MRVSMEERKPSTDTSLDVVNVSSILGRREKSSVQHLLVVVLVVVVINLPACSKTIYLFLHARRRFLYARNLKDS